jgi:5-methylcytosine-specific restriction enzyme A
MPTLPKRQRKKEPWGRSTNQVFYNSSVWRRLRLYHIRNNPLCAAHNAIDEIVAAAIVDHVIPISSGGAKLSPKNLQSLCESCHNKKSAMERHLEVEKILLIDGGYVPTDAGKKYVIDQVIRYI